MSESARAAEYKAFGNMGHRLNKDEKVAARIEELARSYTEQAETNPGAKFKGEAYVCVELAEIHRKAKKAAQFSTCVAALTTLARIGKLIDGPRQGPSGPRTVNFIGVAQSELNQALKASLEHLPAAERKRILADPEMADVIDLVAESESTSRTED